ncbi:hypothetical protein QLX08_003856 [Tetragonisca angustula]|uniref:Uncharacterized protein n=1 Tax=Tetragonisca angustula TaxID=166442 RepID=A0AAW1A4Q2_9HYME
MHANFLENFPSNVADLCNCERVGCFLYASSPGILFLDRVKIDADKRSNSVYHSFTPDTKEIHSLPWKFSPRRLGGNNIAATSTLERRIFWRMKLSISAVLLGLIWTVGIANASMETYSHDYILVAPLRCRAGYVRLGGRCRRLL